MTIPTTSPIFNTFIHMSDRKALFSRPDGDDDQMFTFSSTLEKLGEEWDCSLKNNSLVLVISDPVNLVHTKYGRMTLIKIKANMTHDFHTIIGEFWVPTIFLADIEDEG
jgi:hypothetical protein